MAPRPDAPPRSRARKLAIRLAVSAAVLAAIVGLVPWSKLRAAFADLPPATLALGVAAFLACHAFGTWKWRRVIGAAGASLRYADAAECYAAGLFSNIFLPSIVGGDVMRALLAGRKSGRMEAAILGGAADRLLDIASLGALALAGSFCVGRASGGTARGLFPLAALLGGIAAIAALLLLARLPLKRYPARVRRRVAQLLVALRRQRRRPGALVLSFAGACAMQAALIVLNRSLGTALGIEASWGAWFFAGTLSKVIALVPVGFNGIGTRDLAFQQLFVPFMANAAWSSDERMTRALASSLVWQAVVVLGSLVAGGVWALLRRRNGGGAPLILLQKRATT